MAPGADTIFHNGALWCGRRGPRHATALAVRNGRIEAIGGDDDVLNLRAAATRVVNLEGQALLPGFVDAHAHIWKIGHLLTSLLDLRGSASLADLKASVSSRARQSPPGSWIQGRGYNEARFTGGRGPTRQDLDAVVADRPVVLMRTCAHIVVCNSLALERAGIGPHTPNPPGGEIDRDDNGVPTGILRETAMGLVHRQIPPPGAAEYEGMIGAALRHQLAHGITATNDAGVSPELLSVYRGMDADGALPIRVNVMALRLQDGLSRLPLPESTYVSDRLRIDTVKFFADGGLSGATAALGVPYRHADTRGVLRMDETEFLDMAREAHDAGWRIATHAIGDVAIDQVLRVYERLGAGRRRHRIEHMGLPDATHLERAARLGVIAVPQTIFIAELGRNFRRYLPDELLARAYPVRAMLDAGLTVALSSDAPVVGNDAPIAGIEAAVLRHDDAGVVMAPGQAISVDEALDAYTFGGAVASGVETSRGQLREGMQADLTVVSGKLLDLGPDAPADAFVTSTWVDGQQVFAR